MTQHCPRQVHPTQIKDTRIPLACLQRNSLIGGTMGVHLLLEYFVLVQPGFATLLLKLLSYWDEKLALTAMLFIAIRTGKFFRCMSVGHQVTAF